jgi:GT2 family glycosyltransferase
MEGVTDPAPIVARACIMIINWNGRDNLRSCLKSCFSQDYPEYDVIVLDNASTDDSVDMAQKEFSQVRIIGNRKNLGFTGAGNAGMQFAVENGYRYVLLLANDIVLDSRCLSQSIKYIEQNTKVGMVGFQIVGALCYVPIADFHQASERWESLTVEDANWIEGAAFLIDPNLFIRLGGYDEMLFMYGDENDLENRIRNAGYRLKRINLPAWHNAGRNVMGKRSIRAAFYTLRNTLIILLKENPWTKAIRLYLSPIRIACDPYMKIDDEQIVIKRYRPSNIFVNFLVLLAAVSSVLWNLHGILRNKRLHAAKIEMEQNFRS